MGKLVGAGFIIVTVCTLLRSGASAQSTVREAAVIFELAQSHCEADAGKLWGKSLCGPMLLVDRDTRAVFANQADAEGHLSPAHGIFTGQLPAEINVANTAVAWAGIRWTMLILPLPADPDLRSLLLLHEMWHRVQNELDFPSTNTSSDHLDTRDGRYWLQLEWRALAAALRTFGRERERAVIDAALFRARRHQIFPEAVATERELEMNEGLAEYTGVKLSGARDLPQFVIAHQLTDGPAQTTFVRSFAYATGPAYGLLLDAVAPDWRRKLRKSDEFSELLLRYSGLALPENFALEATKRADVYAGKQLAVAEDERDLAKQKRALAYRARLVEGPVLTIPLRKMNMQFDPGNLVPLESLGSVYPNIRIVDEWGILTVSRGGALMDSGFTRITVTAPTDSKAATIGGDGWTLELKPGWSIQRDARAGDYMVGEKK
ncbi:MAG: hypothetical protein ABIR71_06430 [Chthoniobacterales bacterium]